jgi:hypothetical protein
MAFLSPLFLIVTVLTSHFWREFFRLTGVTLRMSSSYHPQTDSQIERVNQCLETFHCCCIHEWFDWISLAEYCIIPTPTLRWIVRHSKLSSLWLYSTHTGPSSSYMVQSPNLNSWLQNKELTN